MSKLKGNNRVTVLGRSSDGITSNDRGPGIMIPLSLTTLGFLRTVTIGENNSGGNFDPIGIPINIDGILNDNLGNPIEGLVSPSFGYGFNGTNWDRLRIASAATQSAAITEGALIAAKPGDWAITHNPGANVQATISRPAVAGVRHVITSIFASCCNDAAGPTGVGTVFLRDGATGAGTILWSGCMINANDVTMVFSLTGLSIIGSVNTAMTLEFAAAGGANVHENVSLTGYDVN